MATFEEHIEGLTQIDITTTSAPTTLELTEFLKEGVIDCVNKVTQYKPEELSKFTKTENATGSVVKKGKILSVLREHDSESILRMCTPIAPQLRYESTDSESLHYRSKYNPAYYERDGLIYSIPAPNDASNNDIVVTQVHYDTGLAATDNYNVGDIENFPLDYEWLVASYAAAKSCYAAASDIQNNMPTKPIAPLSPDFSNQDTTLPDLPIFNQPSLNVIKNLHRAETAIAREDFDLAEKEMSLFDKHLEQYGKNYESENTTYQNELEIFKADLDMLVKNADRNVQLQVAEYKSELDRYSAEIKQFQLETQEKIAKYKWFVEQHHILMSQYNLTFGIMPRSTAATKKQEKKAKKEEGEEYGDS